MDSSAPKGVYFHRNKLLHGSLELDSPEVTEYIKDLQQYISEAILKILDLIDNEILVCVSNNYFEKLDEFLF